MLRHGLVVAQVAFALVLLMGAGLLTASFRQVLAIRPGFVPEQVVTGTVGLPGARYRDDAAMRAFTERALEKIRALPGVLDAGVTNAIPFGSDFSDSVIMAEGYTMKPGESLISGDNMSVTPGYFEAMKVPLKEGRFFDERDTPDSPRAIIIDERLARKFFPGTNAVGRRMWRPTSPDAFQDPSKGTGTGQDRRRRRADQAARPRGHRRARGQLLLPVPRRIRIPGSPSRSGRRWSPRRSRRPCGRPSPRSIPNSPCSMR